MRISDWSSDVCSSDLAGHSATVPVADGSPARVSIEHLDRTARTIAVKAGSSKAHLLADRLTLHPDWPLNTEVIADALRDVITDQCGARHWTAVDALLARPAPRLASGPRHDLLTRPDALPGHIHAGPATAPPLLPPQGTAG